MPDYLGIAWLSARTSEPNEEAEECLRKALKVDPDYEEAHYNLGYIYRLKGKSNLAEKHLRRAIEIDRKIHWLLQNWASYCRARARTIEQGNR